MALLYASYTRRDTFTAVWTVAALCFLASVSAAIYDALLAGSRYSLYMWLSAAALALGALLVCVAVWGRYSTTTRVPHGNGTDALTCAGLVDAAGTGGAPDRESLLLPTGADEHGAYGGNDDASCNAETGAARRRRSAAVIAVPYGGLDASAMVF